LKFCNSVFGKHVVCDYVCLPFHFLRAGWGGGAGVAGPILVNSIYIVTRNWRTFYFKGWDFAVCL